MAFGQYAVVVVLINGKTDRKLMDGLMNKGSVEEEGILGESASDGEGRSISVDGIHVTPYLSPT